MTQRWGKDQEERSAVALKAQAAYAAARQAMEKINGLEALISALTEELAEARAETGRLASRLRSMELIDTVPKKVPRSRQAEALNERMGSH